MKRLIFTGPRNSVFLEGEKRIASGEEFEVSDRRAAELLERLDIEAGIATEQSAPKPWTGRSYKKVRGPQGRGTGTKEVTK